MKPTDKNICILGYVLFFIPLLVDKTNPDYLFHANQGFNLFILGIILSVAQYIPVVGWIVSLAGGIACLVLFVMGVLNAYNQRNVELPVIGKFRVFK